MSNNSPFEFRSRFHDGLKRLEAEAHKYERQVLESSLNEEKETKSKLKLYRKTIKHIAKVREIIEFHEEQLGQGSFHPEGQ